MSWIGLFIFVFLENFWWTAGVLSVVCIIFIGLFGGGKNVSQMTADEKYKYAIELAKPPVPSHVEKYTKVVLQLSFLIFCLCVDWFFTDIKPQWLPRVADSNWADMESVIYITPNGLPSNKGKFYYEKYGCKFVLAQKLAINYNHSIIGAERFGKNIAREAISELGANKLIKLPVEVVNQATNNYLNYLSSLEAHVEKFGCSNSKDVK
jgi:hypothetical protein